MVQKLKTLDALQSSAPNTHIDIISVSGELTSSSHLCWFPPHIWETCRHIYLNQKVKYFKTYKALSIQRQLLFLGLYSKICKNAEQGKEKLVENGITGLFTKLPWEKHRMVSITSCIAVISGQQKWFTCLKDLFETPKNVSHPQGVQSLL